MPALLMARVVIDKITKYRCFALDIKNIKKKKRFLKH